MNKEVYPVQGGMEDWAYAGSWDPANVPQCKPETYGGYPPEKTTYDTSTLRAFNMLVETSDRKIPKSECLGSNLDLMTNTRTGNGHVARNIRLALLALEMVEPYVTIRSINELDLSDDIVPGVAEPTCRSVAVPFNSRKVTVQWTVGGAFTVDDTALYYAKWDERLEALLTCNGGQPVSTTQLEGLLKKATPIGATSGTTYFHKAGATPPFAASFEIDDAVAGDRLVVVARSKVDQSWGTAPPGSEPPNLPPQSHVVNARTNPDWHHQGPNGAVIQGRVDWYSQPVTIVLQDTKDVETREVSKRFDTSLLPDDFDADNHESGVVPPTTSTNTGSFGHPSKSSNAPVSMTTALLLFGVVGLVLLVGGKKLLSSTVRSSRRERLRDFIEDEDAVSPGLQKDGGYTDKGGAVEMGFYSDEAANTRPIT